jgi:hypothetical protein
MKPLGTNGDRWKNYIKIDVKEIQKRGCELDSSGIA